MLYDLYMTQLHCETIYIITVFLKSLWNYSEYKRYVDKVCVSLD